MYKSDTVPEGKLWLAVFDCKVVIKEQYNSYEYTAEDAAKSYVRRIGQNPKLVVFVDSFEPLEIGHTFELRRVSSSWEKHVLSKELTPEGVDEFLRDLDSYIAATRKPAKKFFKANGRINTKTKRSIRQKLVELYGSACCWCGQETLDDVKPNAPNKRTIEHLIPVCKGGGKGLQNLRIACYRCNQRKDSALEHPEFKLRE